MTSRRKQNKPIKASSHSLEKIEYSEKSQLILLRVKNEPFEESLEIIDNPCAEMENTKLKEEVIVNMDNKDEAAVLNTENIQICGIKKEDNLSKLKIYNSIEDNLDEISKKMNKDEAKILPFQSSGGVDFFKCPLCDQSYICGRESLTIHLQEHQNKTKRDDGKHLCCLCAKELSSNSSLERHLLTHSNHRPFSCFMCDKKFTTNGNLSRHIKTSHNNNETIESSIDEVLKKHQSESEKPTQNLSVENKIGKNRKPSKSSRKDINLNVKSDIIKNEQNFIQSNSSIVEQPLFKTILPANMNFLSPLLSLNISDFSFLQTTQPDHLNLLQTKPIQMITNLSSINNNSSNNKEIISEKICLKNKFQNCKLISLRNLNKSRLYLENRNYYLNQYRKIKENYFKSHLKCRKCMKIFLKINHCVISHIRICNSESKNELKYCVFKFCHSKFRSKHKFINHIKRKHMKTRPSVSPHLSPPNTEPLNLSMKSSNISNSFVSPSDSFITQPEIINRNNHVDNIDINYSNTGFPKALTDSVIDFSSNSNSPWSFTKSVISQIATTNTLFNQFYPTNQFISSSPLFTASPMSLTSSLKSDWNGLNKVEFNENSTILSDCHSQLNSLSLKNGTNSTISSITRNSIENLSTRSNSLDFNSSSPLMENMKLKYTTGIKKKNSYKDAPKLITCPMEGCVQKFPWNSSLMRHILTHTAHKPFKCTRCTKCFSTKSNRERHMTRVHGVRINRSKFKSIQAAKANFDESSKLFDENADSENGNMQDESMFPNDKEMNITELSEEEWIIMDNNDRRAEDISNNLLKLAGQPLVEPNPVRLNNNPISLLEKSISPKSEFSSKPCHSLSKERFYLDSCF